MHMVPLSSDSFCPLSHITRKPADCGYAPDTARDYILPKSCIASMTIPVPNAINRMSLATRT